MMIEKEPRLRHPHLLLMARKVRHPCLLRVPGVCRTGLSDTQCCACHGNSQSFNKGGAIKAHDFFTVWGCARCHNWLDSSYIAGYAEKQQAFIAALDRQIVAWSEIATSLTAKPDDRDAAVWALDHLVERGFAQYDLSRYATPLEVAHG